MTIQKKMIEICKLTEEGTPGGPANARWYDGSGADANDEDPNSEGVKNNGLCGGWTHLFENYPDWTKAVWESVRTWDPSSDDDDATKLNDLNERIAKYPEEAFGDGKGVEHVISALGGAWNKMNELEPDAGYGPSPLWTNKSVRRYIWDRDENIQRSPEVTLKVQPSSTEESSAEEPSGAGAQVLSYIRGHTSKNQETMTHVETGAHHMSVRVAWKNGAPVITVVETERGGIRTVNTWEEAADFLQGGFVEEDTEVALTMSAIRRA